MFMTFMVRGGPDDFALDAGFGFGAGPTVVTVEVLVTLPPSDDFTVVVVVLTVFFAPDGAFTVVVVVLPVVVLPADGACLGGILQSFAFLNKFVRTNLRLNL